MMLLLKTEDKKEKTPLIKKLGIQIFYFFNFVR